MDYDMSGARRSALKEQPKRYRIMTPTELIPPVSSDSRWAEWRQRLRERYGT